MKHRKSLPAIRTASFFRPACHFTAGSIKSVTIFKASDWANSLWEFNVFLKLPICLDRVKNIFSLSSGSTSSLQRTSLKMDTIRSEKIKNLYYSEPKPIQTLQPINFLKYCLIFVGPASSLFTKYKKTPSIIKPMRLCAKYKLILFLQT